MNTAHPLEETEIQPSGKTMRAKARCHPLATRSGIGSGKPNETRAADYKSGTWRWAT